jgi:hypothetical protein
MEKRIGNICCGFLPIPLYPPTPIIHLQCTVFVRYSAIGKQMSIVDWVQWGSKRLISWPLCRLPSYLQLLHFVKQISAVQPFLKLDYLSWCFHILSLHFGRKSRGSLCGERYNVCEMWIWRRSQIRGRGTDVHQTEYSPPWTITVLHLKRRDDIKNM